MYDVPLLAQMLEYIELFNNNPARPDSTEAINNIYELPSIARAVRYLHGAIGFPTKATWLTAIRNGNFLTWPLITVNNVNKHFPESEETQKGHQHNQRQGVHPTNRKSSSTPAALATSAPPTPTTPDTGLADAASAAGVDEELRLVERTPWRWLRWWPF